MNQRHPQPWCDAVVEPNLAWEGGPEGGAVLLVPRFRSGPLARWLQPRLKNKHMRVKLDEIGSFAWKHFDGRTTVAAIAQAMRERFGALAEPAEDRLHRFLLLLMKDRFVQLLVPSMPPVR